MAKLELECYGVRACVTGRPAGLLSAVAERLAPICHPAGAVGNPVRSEQPQRIDVRFGVASLGDGRYLVTRGGSELITAQLPEALDCLESYLHEDVATRSPDKIFVHAGVVAWRGRALVLPGETRSGKTTLVAALIRAGASYLSDEYAVLDSGGVVHPFARPLSIRVDGDMTEQQHVSTLGGEAVTTPLPIGMIAMLRYRAGATWRPSRLSSGDAMLAILRHAAQARDRPADTLLALKLAVKGAIAIEGNRGEADRAADALLGALATADV